MAFDCAFHRRSDLVGIDGAVVAVVELKPGFTWQLRALHHGAVIGQVVDAPIAVIQVFTTADAEIHKRYLPIRSGLLFASEVPPTPWLSLALVPAMNPAQRAPSSPRTFLAGRCAVVTKSPLIFL